jgi:hypothetical protein
MKRRIDLEKAADAERFGALALRAGDEQKRGADIFESGLTQAQIRAVSEQARSLFQFAALAGADNKRILIGDIAFDLQKSGSRQTLFLRAESVSQKIIAIGKRGTAFANVNAQQLRPLRLNAYNPVLKKTHRSSIQKAKRDSGQYQGVLWADSCSWITPRGGEFWIGTLEEALARHMVRKARITAKRGGATENLLGYVRADFDPSGDLSKDHKIIAVETQSGRIEATPVRKENGNGYRNTPYIREILAVELESDR